MRPERWLQVAGVGAWLAASLPAFADMTQGTLSGERLLLWAAAAATFLAAFAASSSLLPARRVRFELVSLVLLQAVCAFGLIWTNADALAASALLVVVAGQLPWIVPPHLALVWVSLQTVGLVGLLGLFTTPPRALTYGLAFGAFQLFALSTGALARRERDARDALTVANAELHANRALLAETSRAGERLRISRDLHDALGHHLTALSLQLDVAVRRADERTVVPLRQAHALTRLLLADVRDVVGRLRESSRFDLGKAVRTLVAESPDRPVHQPHLGAVEGLTVHLIAPDAIAVDEDASAHALLRSVQEILTNTTRHAEARNLWIKIESGPEGLTLHANDDGRGAEHVTWGHGLTGMRERFEALAGSVEVETSAGRGFQVRGFLPRTQAAS